MKTIQVSRSVEKELESLPKWKLMLYLQENGETSVYQISKDLSWTTGKTHAIVTSLLKSGEIHFTFKPKGNNPSTSVLTETIKLSTLP